MVEKLIFSYVYQKKFNAKSITKMESKPDSCQILEKIESSSFKLLGEGAILESTGSKNQMYFVDGTRADSNGQLSTVSRTSLDSDVVD